MLIRLQYIFRDVFDDEFLTITPETSRKKMKEWDSVAHVKLILTISSEFGITFTVEEVTQIKSVRDFIQIINHAEENHK